MLTTKRISRKLLNNSKKDILKEMNQDRIAHSKEPCEEDDNNYTGDGNSKTGKGGQSQRKREEKRFVAYAHTLSLSNGLSFMLPVESWIRSFG